MVALNDRASAVMCSMPVHACSDVTGFGLLGHAFEMASGSSVTIVLESKKLPVLPGADASRSKDASPAAAVGIETI